MIVWASIGSINNDNDIILVKILKKHPFALPDQEYEIYL